MIDEPYLYVSVWWPDRAGIDPTDERWDAPGFVGRVRRLAEFPATDPARIAAEFWSASRDLIGSPR